MKVQLFELIAAIQAIMWTDGSDNKQAVDMSDPLEAFEPAFDDCQITRCRSEMAR
jgi:hypothetical protein